MLQCRQSTATYQPIEVHLPLIAYKRTVMPHYQKQWSSSEFLHYYVHVSAECLQTEHTLYSCYYITVSVIVPFVINIKVLF